MFAYSTLKWIFSLRKINVLSVLTNVVAAATVRSFVRSFRVNNDDDGRRRRRRRRRHQPVSHRDHFIILVPYQGAGLPVSWDVVPCGVVLCGVVHVGLSLSWNTVASGRVNLYYKNS